MLVSENLILVALGTIPGLIVGYIVAWGFMASFSSDLFQFNLQMRTSTLFFSALIMIVIALISLWPGLRFVRRINLGQVMRERAT
jgi:putative ABC transport system permease protein